MASRGPAVVLAAFALLAAQDLAQAKPPGEIYAAWIPGDALFIVNEQNQAWEPCFSRDPQGCPQDWNPIGAVERISADVIQTPAGTYFCKVSVAEDLQLINADCTRDGWSAASCPEQQPGSTQLPLCIRGTMGPL